MLPGMLARAAQCLWAHQMATHPAWCMCMVAYRLANAEAACHSRLALRLLETAGTCASVSVPVVVVRRAILLCLLLRAEGRYRQWRLGTCKLLVAKVVKSPVAV